MLKKFTERIQSLTSAELIFIILAFHSIFFLMSEVSEQSFATNYRTGFFLSSPNTHLINSPQVHKGFVIQIEECLTDKDCQISSLEIADDLGPALIFWLGNKFTPVIDDYSQINPNAYTKSKDHPLISRIFYIVIHFIFLILLLLWSKKTLGTAAALILNLSLSFFENFFFIAYSNDVYLFPVYMITVCLGLISFKHNTFKKVLVLGMVAGILCWFRSSSWIIFVGFCFVYFIYLIFKKQYKDSVKIGVGLLTAYLFFKLPLVIFNNPYHIFWHSMHAGLYEHGGIKTHDNKFIPLHLIKPEDYKNSVVVFDSWMDAIQSNIVSLHDPKIKIYSKEYESVLKQNYFELLKHDPIENLKFYLARIPKILSFYPYKEHVPSGEINFKPYNQFFGYLFFIIFILFIVNKQISSIYKVTFSFFLASSSIPSFLVHPNYIIYNAPILFSQWMIILILLSTTLKQYYRSQPLIQ